MAKKHKYVLTIEFESDRPVTRHKNWEVQFENGLGYFVDTKQDKKDRFSSINESFVYGTGKTKLKKVRK